MPQLGAHVSIAGGLSKAFDRLKEIDGGAMQIFTKNQRQWHAPPMDRQTADLFLEYWRRAGSIPVAAHDAYLINLAALE